MMAALGFFAGCTAIGGLGTLALWFASRFQGR
jgi:hypothetical protein